ncbi:MAG: hypothetical protein CL861_01870 [Cyanobium sp. MED843]|nr:hypothetical protein [Cyanobium sp. MED843]OUW29958.1 MAG: hypothetical protein CBD37_02105 [Cyanobacteria bacterium TMED177]
MPGVWFEQPSIDQDFVAFAGMLPGLDAQCRNDLQSPVQDPSKPPFEGFSERVTDGSDDERTEAYGRWLKRLRDNQSSAEGEDASTDQGPDQVA